MAGAIQPSRVPVVISHTGYKAVHDHIRNTTDENLRLLADEVLPYFIEGLNGPRRMEPIWDELVDLGFSEDEVEKIMGGNLYRVYEEVLG